MKLLIISPETKGLFVPNVQQFVADLEDLGIRSDQVSGRVTYVRIREALAAENYEVLVWLGHGMPGELLLYEEKVSARWLCDRLASSSIQVVLLAACYGALRQGNDVTSSFSDMLPAVGIDTVAMGSEVTELAAFAYLVGFLENYQDSHDVRKSHQFGLDRVLHSPYTSKDFIIPELHRADSSSRVLRDQVDRVVEETRLSERVTRLEAKVNRILKTLYPPPLVVLLMATALILIGSLWTSLSFETVRNYYVANPLITGVLLLLSIGLIASLFGLAWFIIREESQK